MADTHVYYRELRVIIEEELTQVYVLLDAYPDAPLGVQGWHHKTFPASRHLDEILQSADFTPMMWPQAAPP